MIGTSHYLAVSGALFSLGLYGLLTRRNILLILLSIELMLNAGNLAFVAFSAHTANLAGQAVVFFTMIVAAVEVTVGLAIVLLLFRSKKTSRVDGLESLKW